MRGQAGFFDVESVTDRDARWTVKYTKAKPSADGAPRIDLAIPAFGYKNHVGIDRRHRLIRRWTVTDAARHDGALLPELIDPNNTAGEVWADTAYRSQANEKFLAGRVLRSQIHRKKPNSLPRRRCFVSEDWRDGVRLWQAIERLRRQLRPDQAQLVPIVHRRDPRAGAATAASLAARRVGGACGPTGASVPTMHPRRRRPIGGRTR